jgi:hypothetical protein
LPGAPPVRSRLRPHNSNPRHAGRGPIVCIKKLFVIRSVIDARRLPIVSVLVTRQICRDWSRSSAMLTFIGSRSDMSW